MRNRSNEWRDDDRRPSRGRDEWLSRKRGSDDDQYGGGSYSNQSYGDFGRRDFEQYGSGPMGDEQFGGEPLRRGRFQGRSGYGYSETDYGFPSDRSRGFDEEDRYWSSPNDQARRLSQGYGSTRNWGGTGIGYEGSQTNWRHSRFDDDYSHWRNEQLSKFDKDYADYQTERRKKFSEEFDKWRSSRPSSMSETSGSQSSTSKNK